MTNPRRVVVVRPRRMGERIHIWGTARNVVPHKNSSQIARAIKRLRTHGIVKKVAGEFRSYLTTFGQAVVASALKLKEMFLVPSLRGHLATP